MTKQYIDNKLNRIMENKRPEDRKAIADVMKVLDDMARMGVDRARYEIVAPPSRIVTSKADDS